MYRTRICKNYEHGFCQFGNECLYAHGEDKLRKIPTLDICWFYNNGICTNGDNCPYIHEKRHVRKPVKLQKPCWDYHIKKNCTDDCNLDHFELTEEEFTYHFPGVFVESEMQQKSVQEMNNVKIPENHKHVSTDIWRPTDPKHQKLYFNSHSYNHHPGTKRRHSSDKKTVEGLVNLIKESVDKIKTISKNNPELYEMAISRLL
jgi:hypothetical protein